MQRIISPIDSLTFSSMNKGEPLRFMRWGWSPAAVIDQALEPVSPGQCKLYVLKSGAKSYLFTR